MIAIDREFFVIFCLGLIVKNKLYLFIVNSVYEGLNKFVFDLKDFNDDAFEWRITNLELYLRDNIIEVYLMT